MFFLSSLPCVSFVWLGLLLLSSPPLTAVFVRSEESELTQINQTVEAETAEEATETDQAEKVEPQEEDSEVTRTPPPLSPSPSPNPDSQTEEQEDNPAPAHEEAEQEEQEEQEESFEPPQQAVRVCREEEAGPLNLHQSPPTHRPTPSYHPTIESSHGPPGYYPPYNQHYFNNANNNYNGQTSFMPPGWSAEQHEMYIGRAPPPPPPHDSHHSSHLAHPGLSHLGLQQFGRMAALPHGDPYNFPNSDEELCSPGRPGGQAPLNMGFSGIPMPLIAPKAQKPRKPRKPRSPKQEGLLSMQMKEDSRR